MGYVKWYYNYGTLRVSDSTDLLNGDDVIVKIWFQTEEDMNAYTEFDVVSIGSMKTGCVWIEIVGGTDKDNYDVIGSGKYKHAS